MKKPMIAAFAAALLVTACQTQSDMDMAGTRFQELPPNIQETARDRIGNAEIVDVDQENRTGITVYEITYAGMDNNREKLHIRQDGTLLSKADSSVMRNQEIVEAAGAETKVTTQTAAPSAGIETRSSGAAVQVDSNINAPELKADVKAEGPSIGTRFEDLPAAVQATINEKAAGAKISDIDKEERTGQVIYEVSFADEGLNPKIHVSQDGSLVGEEESELLQNEAAGAQAYERIEATPEVRGGAQALTEGAPALTDAEIQAKADLDASNDLEAKADVTSEAAGAEPQTSVQVGKPTQVRFNALPQPVQNVIRTRGGEAKVSEINRKTVYEVKFADGAEKLTISETGTIVDEKK